LNYLLSYLFNCLLVVVSTKRSYYLSQTL